MMKHEILGFLKDIGVDNRFISLWNGFIFINNLKFSRFSRRREELFLARFADCQVIRSKVFQKMSIRASRVLSKSLSPGKIVSIDKSNNCANLALYMILEPYTRKYGIRIIRCDEMEAAKDCEADMMASALTLDREVQNIVYQMFHGLKIQSTLSNTRSGGLEIIYPLINIPESWIELWADRYNLTCSKPTLEAVSKDFLNFFDQFVPEVRENMLKSALYVVED